MKCRQGFISNSSSSSFIVTTDVFHWDHNKNFRNRDPKTGRFVKVEKKVLKMTQKNNVYVKELVDIDLSYESFLKELTTKHDVLKSNGVEEILVEYDSDYSGYVVLYGYRLETDEEFNSRISREVKNIENKKNNLKSALINFSKEYLKEFKELMEEIQND